LPKIILYGAEVKPDHAGIMPDHALSLFPLTVFPLQSIFNSLFFARFERKDQIFPSLRGILDWGLFF
jgi:hypothetical protein